VTTVRSGSGSPPEAPVVVVVGAGIAGTAAALAATRAGARVTVVDDATGASSLATGAIDLVPWEDAPAAPTALTALVQSVLDALGAYEVPDAGARVPTMAGIVRPCRGHDAALLDIRSTVGRVGVVRSNRPGWDAAALARAWGDGFEPVDATILRHVDEAWLPDADLATRHDDASRVGWLADRLREALARHRGPIAALVLPPLLGVERSCAQTLSAAVGLPCGEAITAPGGPSGLRFERARDRALTAAGIARFSGWVRGVARDGDRLRVNVDAGDPGKGPPAADAVVLAMGGLLGGGLEYDPAESVIASALPPFARPSFRLSIAAPVALGAQGKSLEPPSTLFGIAPESIAWPFVSDGLMDRVGVLADGQGRAGHGLYVGGELLADRPRTWLDALATGAAAGEAAAADRRVTAMGPASLAAAPPSRP
jgi:glycerol-3-phosphate dehydrogenase subunit B